jgi:hypothetical protein
MVVLKSRGVRKPSPDALPRLTIEVCWKEGFLDDESARYRGNALAMLIRRDAEKSLSDRLLTNHNLNSSSQAFSQAFKPGH